MNDKNNLNDMPLDQAPIAAPSDTVAPKNEKPEKKKKPKLPDDLSAVTRFRPSVEQGLTDEQVASRIDEGFVNDDGKKSKSIAQIVFTNTFTFFNVLYFVIAFFLCVHGLFNQCTFLPVVIANTLIAIVQEIKSKKTLDKLNLITEPKCKVVRSGVVQEIGVKEIVLDDVAYVVSGDQIAADGIVLVGSVEVNEAILTGESESVVKRVGDCLYAGSFVVSGSCTVQITAVGRYNYVSGLTDKAKQYQKPRSQMLKSLKTILLVVAIVIIPATISLYVINCGGVYAEGGGKFSLFNLNKEALKFTAGSIITMIPAGPFLLTSIALAASFLRLAKNNAMVQELYCIEMLARVDTLCLDKTGTITDGTMRVVECIDLRQGSQSSTVREIVSSMNRALSADNMTSKALKKYFGNPQMPPLTAVSVVPFSSERKLSAVSFKGAGTYFLGAPEFVLKTKNQRVDDLCAKYAAEGLRVLLLAHSSSQLSGKKALPEVRRPVAVIVIEDHIRDDAEQTILWFKSNGVSVKVISGDNPQTVSNIAMRVGVENADKYVSLEGMSEEQVIAAATEYTVFGRVSPEQKAILVRAMREAGATVAMTGDGVNDILAMKESDCSVSFAGGSDAARNVSHLVLMDDSFSSLPKVVAEGRRVVNNVQSATGMYFMKTIYVIVINLMLIVMYFGFGKEFKSPFASSQLMLLEWVVVALPTTILALQPNESLIRGNFLMNVLRRCLPASLTFIVATVALYVTDALCTPPIFDGNVAQFSTVVTISYTFGGIYALFFACRPFEKWWKKVLYGAIWFIVVLGISLPQTRKLFEYASLTREQFLLSLVVILAMPFIMYGFFKLFSLRAPKDPAKQQCKQ